MTLNFDSTGNPHILYLCYPPGAQPPVLMQGEIREAIRTGGAWRQERIYWFDCNVSELEGVPITQIVDAKGTAHIVYWESPPSPDYNLVYARFMTDTSVPTAAVVNPGEGGTIDREVLNARKYLEVAFADPVGIPASSIADAAPEFTLGGGAAAGVKIGAPKLLAGTTYRYAFTGAFSGGDVTVNFTVGSFADTAGNTNLATTQSFTVTVDATKPTAALCYPANVGSVDIDVLNNLGYMDVTFSDAAAVNLTTITDTAPEFTLSGPGVGTVKVGAPKLVSGTTYRYPFTGNVAAGDVALSFPAGAFADLAGNTNDATTQTFTVAPATGQRFGTIGGKKGMPLLLDDADGTHVKFSMTGAGFGELDINNGLWNLRIGATSSASAVTITTTKSKVPGDDGEMDLAGLETDYPLRSVTGKTTNLTNAVVAMYNQLATLTLDDLANVTMLFVPTPGAAGPALVFDEVRDTVINSPAAFLKSLTLTKWVDTGGAQDKVSAPWIGSLTVKGRAANVAKGLTLLPGDFAAALQLTGQDPKGKSLGTFSVAGQITSPIIQLAGAAGPIKGAAWAGTALTAKSVGTVAVKGDMTNVAMALSQAPDPKLKAMGTLTVGGKMDSCQIDAAGHIGTVTVGALLASTVEAGDLADTALTQAALGTLSIKGVAGMTNAVVGSNIRAWSLGTVTLRDVKMPNGGTAFGVQGHTLASYTRYAAKVIAKRATILTGPLATPVEADTDFAVTLV
jgi:hypothetical protein